MKSIRHYLLPLITIILMFIIVLSDVYGAKEPKRISTPAKVGRFKAAKFFPGHMNYVANVDSEWKEMLHYHGSMSLWVSAKSFLGNRKVTSGDGNEISRKFEWVPTDYRKLNNVTNIPDIDDICQTEYTDKMETEGHTPLGVDVVQTVYSFKNKNYQILKFELTNESGSVLREAAAGISSSFIAPDNNNRLFKSKEKLIRLNNVAVPVIKSDKENTQSCPLLGIIPLGSELKRFSYSTESLRDNNDNSYYNLLSENKAVPQESAAGKYSAIVSSVPGNLNNNETIVLTAAIIQADGEKNFKSALKEVAAVYKEYIDTPKSLAKKSAGSGMPAEFEMLSNYPNPFNPETTVRFSLPKSSNIRITVYDILGSEVTSLAEGYYFTGNHTVRWDGKNKDGMQVTSGIYLVRMVTDQQTLVHKITFIK